MNNESQNRDRDTIRLKGYDYSRRGEYFVTIASHNKICRFGRINDGRMELNTIGDRIDRCWKAIPEHCPFVLLDEYVIMPNHIHGILRIDTVDSQQKDDSFLSPLPGRSFGTAHPHSLSTVIGSFKTATTKELRICLGDPLYVIWQRNFYEHIIRNDRDMNRIRDYIRHNPSEWDSDMENPDFSGVAKQG